MLVSRGLLEGFPALDVAAGASLDDLPRIIAALGGGGPEEELYPASHSH